MTAADAQAPLVLTLGLADSTTAGWTGVRVLSTTTKEELLERVADEDAALLVLGPHLPVDETLRVVRRCREELPARRLRCIVSGVGAHIERFQVWIDDDSMFYVSRGALSPDNLQRLVRAATGPSVRPRRRNASAEPPVDPDVLLDLLGRLSEAVDLSAAGRLLVETMRMTAAADGGECFVYDERSQTLQSKDARTGEPRIDSAAAGLVSYVARTGEGLAIAGPSDDPRYDPDVDNPTAAPVAHVAAEPIAGDDGAVLAVVAVVREAAHPPFSAKDLRAIAQLTSCAAPAFRALLHRQSRRQQLMERAVAMAGGAPVYRQEALAHHMQAAADEGRLLATYPPWLRTASWVSLGLLVALLAFVAIRLSSELVLGNLVPPLKGLMRP